VTASTLAIPHRPASTRLATARHRLRGRPGLAIGAALLALYLLAALVGPLVVPGDPYQQNLRLRAASPTLTAPFGYDELGRNLFTRIIHGARITIGISLAAVVLGGGLGILVGAAAGLRGGWLDTVLMRLVDVLLAFPSLIIALAIVATFGAGIRILVIATALYTLPQYARLTRATFLGLRGQEYVTAAEAAGVTPAGLVTRHLLPNAMAPLIVQTSYAAAAVVLAASGLSFLGLGVQPPSPEWGAMLSRGREFLRVAPHIVVVPGVTIALLIMALNLTGDGLRDLLDPRLRNR
jgi:peptide/nickel transport system permease protein